MGAQVAAVKMLSHPSVLLFLTVGVYWLANILRARTGRLVFNPVLISTVCVIAYLKAFGIDYESYHQAGRFIDFWLKPAVVVLAVPLYLNRQKIRDQWLPVVAAQLAGSFTGIVTGVYLAKWMGAGRETVLSVASKSVTNPVAIEITQAIGGIPAVTAATVIVAGLTGQMLGVWFLKTGRVAMPSSLGLSLGTASHAMGITASLERSKRIAAYAGLGLILNSIFTAVLAPLVVPLMVG
ncbi:LrgB family protein [Neisseria sp.]|uniref:LrgB family protein n=1 Tax=Neisseria sp. TaxID=192066 RepID=UPI0035A0645D